MRMNETVNLVTFTEEIPDGKLNFCAVQKNGTRDGFENLQ